MSTTVSPRHRAFTLTEVLVVLGVVMLLAAILFPVIIRAREAGRRVTCINNLRQIGFGLQAYLQDSRGVYPYRQSYGNGDNCAWPHRLVRYTKSPAIFICPSYPQGQFDGTCKPEDEEQDPPVWFNGGYDWNNRDLSSVRPLTQNSIRRPSETILLGDGNATHEALMDPGAPSITTPDQFTTTDTGPRHGQGMNVLFADSHVRWLSLEQLLDKSLWNYRK